MTLCIPTHLLLNGPRRNKRVPTWDFTMYYVNEFQSIELCYMWNSTVHHTTICRHKPRGAWFTTTKYIKVHVPELYLPYATQRQILLRLA
jgi:hypothetical protein